MSKDWIDELQQLDAWTLSELACLCLGIAPEDRIYSSEAEIESVIKVIERAVSSGVLTPNIFSSGDEQEFSPAEATIWAKKKYPLFLFRSRVIIEQTQEILVDANSMEEKTNIPKCSSVIQVGLPHMTQRLNIVFDIMREHWQDYDPERVPKQTNIAAQINMALGYAEKSREGQILATLIRPDELRDADSRVKKKNDNQI
jgi:hypothetical protein